MKEMRPHRRNTAHVKYPYIKDLFPNFYDFIMICYDFSMPQNRKMTPQTKIKKSKTLKKNEHLGKKQKKKRRQLRQFAI